MTMQQDKSVEENRAAAAQELENSCSPAGAGTAKAVARQWSGVAVSQSS